ncbi:MAG: M28 family metallopeptidase [Gammaproteobacteria bacterium]
MNKRSRFSHLPVCVIGGALLAMPGLRPWAAGDAADAAMATIRPEAIRADMRFLADDLLEGRGTGARGYDIAAAFVATRFEALGLAPAGEKGSYFQTVPLRSLRVDLPKSSFTLMRGGKERSLQLRQDALLAGNSAVADSAVEAPVVFVGYGVTAPEKGYDDYKHVDVKGKIVAYLFGAPNFDSSLKAHYTSSLEKRRNAAAHGAAGLILINDPVLEKLYSFAHRVRDLAIPGYAWLDPQGQPAHYFPQLKASASLSLEETVRLFEGSGHTAEQVFAAANAGKSRSFVLPLVAKLETVTEWKELHSVNVAAKLEGSDPTLMVEHVVYTAHLDHLGISTPVDGDSIYNGALDNASGTAEMLQIARAFSSMQPRPRRSIMFVAVAGEEAGLLGSDYFATYPTVAQNSIVANVNTDEVEMLWPLRDVVAFGAEHSTLNSAVERAAQRLHLVQSPDPVPQEVAFVRSDQYSFVRQGIPAMMVSPGFKSDDPGIVPAKIFEMWGQTRYHQPQDDMQQPGLDFESAAVFGRFAFLCGYEIAQDTARPTWNAGDFFGAHYAKK